MGPETCVITFNSKYDAKTRSLGIETQNIIIVTVMQNVKTTALHEHACESYIRMIKKVKNLITFWKIKKSNRLSATYDLWLKAES